jgi:hypothetical protein
LQKHIPKQVFTQQILTSLKTDLPNNTLIQTEIKLQNGGFGEEKKGVVKVARKWRCRCRWVVL